MNLFVSFVLFFKMYYFISTLQNCFELYNPSHKGQVIKACKTEADGRVVEGNHVVYRISAPTPEEKEEWIKSIKWVWSLKCLSEMKCKLFSEYDMKRICCNLLEELWCGNVLED